MLELKIFNKDLETVEVKKIPLSWTISSLKNFFSKTQKIPVGLMKLLVKLDDDSPEEEIT